MASPDVIHFFEDPSPAERAILDAWAAEQESGVRSVVMPHPIIFKDGLQSVRRAWLPSELELLARIAGAARSSSSAPRVGLRPAPPSRR